MWGSGHQFIIMFMAAFCASVRAMVSIQQLATSTVAARSQCKMHANTYLGCAYTNYVLADGCGGGGDVHSN
jgi:hypothetical protein